MNDETIFTGGARNSDPGTSHDAAAQDFTGIALTVLDHIKAAGNEGKTWSELEIATGIARQTISPRFAQLRERDLIRDSGTKRKAPTGRFQIAWVATTPEEMERIRAAVPPSEKLEKAQKIWKRMQERIVALKPPGDPYMQIHCIISRNIDTRKHDEVTIKHLAADLLKFFCQPFSS